MSESTARAYPTGLTKRQRQVVDVVRFRNAPPGSPCYVLPCENGTSDLYVPVMYGETPAGPLHERLWRVTSATIKRAVDTQAVAIGPAQRSDALRGLPTGRIVAPLTIGDWRAPSPDDASLAPA